MPAIAGKHQFQRRRSQCTLEQIIQQLRGRSAHLRFHVLRNRAETGLERDQDVFNFGFGKAQSLDFRDTAFLTLKEPKL